MEVQTCAVGGRRRCGTAYAVASSGSFASPTAIKAAGLQQAALFIPVVAVHKVFRQFRSSPHRDVEDSPPVKNAATLFCKRCVLDRCQEYTVSSIRE